MKEPFEDETGVERGAAEEASGVSLTPTEEQSRCVLVAAVGRQGGSWKEAEILLLRHQLGVL